MCQSSKNQILRCNRILIFTCSRSLDTRIRHIPNPGRTIPVRIPRPASGLEVRRVPDGALDLALPLDKLHAQTLRGVERNVTVHHPRSGVVCGERDQQVAAAGEHRSIAAGRVVEVEPGRRAVPRIGAAADDVEVMALECVVSEIRCKGTAVGFLREDGWDERAEQRPYFECTTSTTTQMLDMAKDAKLCTDLVLGGHFAHVRVVAVVGVACERLLKRRVLPVDNVSGAINGPAEKVVGAREEKDIQLVGRRNHILRYRIWDEGNEVLFVVAVSRQNNIGCARGIGIRSTIIMKDCADRDASSEDVVPAARRSEPDPQPVVADGLISINDDVVSLSCRAS
jgi:hypothetical protein